MARTTMAKGRQLTMEDITIGMPVVYAAAGMVIKAEVFDIQENVCRIKDPLTGVLIACHECFLFSPQ